MLDQEVYGFGTVLGGLEALTAAKVFPLYFISCENHYTYGFKINLYVLLIPTVIYECKKLIVLIILSSQNVTFLKGTKRKNKKRKKHMK